jgi:hypothetical protein
MSQKRQLCELIEKCKFFNSLQVDAVRRGWSLWFCKNPAKFGQCERKKLRLAGKIPQNDMTPTGRFLHEYPDHQ